MSVRRVCGKAMQDDQVERKHVSDDGRGARLPARHAQRSTLYFSATGSPSQGAARESGRAGCLRFAGLVGGRGTRLHVSGQIVEIVAADELIHDAALAGAALRCSAPLATERAGALYGYARAYMTICGSFQTRTVRSSPAEMMRRPSAMNCAQLTVPS